MSQPIYTLYFSPDSASFIVRLALRLTGASFAERQIDRPAGELDSPAYRAMHPLGKIPAMETPDGPMFETAAMLLYLAERHTGLAPSPASPERAAFLKWFFYTVTNLHAPLMQVFYPDRVAGQECSAAVVAHQSAKLKEHFAILDQMWPVTRPIGFRPSHRFFRSTWAFWCAGCQAFRQVILRASPPLTCPPWGRS